MGGEIPAGHARRGAGEAQDRARHGPRDEERAQGEEGERREADAEDDERQLADRRERLRLRHLGHEPGLDRRNPAPGTDDLDRTVIDVETLPVGAGERGIDAIRLEPAARGALRLATDELAPLADEHGRAGGAEAGLGQEDGVELIEVEHRGQHADGLAPAPGDRRGDRDRRRPGQRRDEDALDRRLGGGGAEVWLTGLHPRPRERGT